LSAQTFGCEACGARVPHLRRGRCSVCYLRWAESRPVGYGSSCLICAERRRENLRLIEFQGNTSVMCHNCAGRTFRMTEVPNTIEGLREALGRDRRWSSRRGEKKDKRIFRINRRRQERRVDRPRHQVEWLDANDLIIESVELESKEEATRIAAVPPPLPKDAFAL